MPRESPPHAVAAWFSALRPKTLPAVATPVLVGSAYAYDVGAFNPVPATAALAGALLIQIGTNLANDFYDHHKGADTPDRAGPERATAQGWIQPSHVLGAAFAAFALAAAVGLYLIVHAGWPILLIGLASLASGWAYTGGPYPLGYHGWGDVFVLVFFGPVAVAGTYYVQAGPAPWTVVLAGLALGSLATAILVVNNLRDRVTDERAGKRTLAVRFGDGFARWEYAVAVLVPFALAYLAPALWTLAALPFAVILVAGLWRTRDPHRLNRYLPLTALLLLLFGALLAFGVVR
jgi:1,4-dihydroxy-2-naphthoate polyprenyltransferase